MAGFDGSVGTLYVCWAMFTLVGCLGPHLLLAVAYVLFTRRPNPPSTLVLEVIYGLVNPLLYLLVIQPVLFRQWTPSWLVGLSWIALATFWLVRLGLIQLPAAWVRRLLLGIFALLVSVAIRDAAAFFTDSPLGPPKWNEEPSHWWSAVLCVPLYALPALMLWPGLRSDSPDFVWMTGRPSRTLRFSVLALGAMLVLSTLPRRSLDSVRAELLEHRETIMRTSQERHLDPRLLAALAEVTQREYQTPFRSALETTATDAWLFDSKSNMLIGDAIDPSLGLTQVKANTLLTAYAIVELSHPGTPTYLSKHYRSVRFLSAQELVRIPRPSLQHVRLPTREPLPNKDEVVAAVKMAEGNLAAAAFILDVYATQWELADPRWSIRDKPEILATLFQIGFAHSWPKADPRSNEFGTRVAAAMEDPWMEEHFGARGQTP